MRRSVRSTIVAAAAVGSLCIGVAAQAGGGDKVRLCHGTASATNPYVLISVSESALEGHLLGESGHGWKNAPDFVLPVGSTDCADGPGVPGGGGGGGGEL